MPYVNFKEENYKLLKQVKYRKESNLSIKNKILKNRGLIEKYMPFDEKYSFRNIKNKIIGSKRNSKEDDFKVIADKNIICSVFYGCKFENTRFLRCNFIGCKFEKCIFSGNGVVFEECLFTENQSFDDNNLNKDDNFSSYFKECFIYSKFLRCEMSYLIFENTKFKNTNFEFCNLKSSILKESNLEKVKICDCNLQSFKTYRCYLKDFKFDDEYKSVFDENTYFDKLINQNRDRDEYEGIYMIYQNIANKYKENTLENNFGEYYFLAKKEQHKVLDFLPKIASKIYYLSCGYGERPIYSVYFSLALILVFTFVYLLFGIEIDGKIIAYNSVNSILNISYAKFFKDFMEALSLSVGMFAGIGVENSLPAVSSYIFSIIEMLLGVVMVGVGIGTLSRKIIR